MPDVIVPAKPKPVEVPIDLQAAAEVIEQHKGKDDDEILEVMVRTAGSISEAAHNVKKAHDAIMQNAMATPMQNLSNAKKRTRELHDAATAKLADLRDKIDKKLVELEAATLPQPAKDMLGVVVELKQIEARSALRQMKPDERLKVVRDAIEAGDAVFAGAVINGSTHHLSGLGPAEAALARDMWQRKWAPDTLTRVTKLRAAQKQLDRLSDLFTNWSAGIYREKDAAIAAAERSAQLADAAMAVADAS